MTLLCAGPSVGQSLDSSLWQARQSFPGLCNNSECTLTSSLPDPQRGPFLQVVPDPSWHGHPDHPHAAPGDPWHQRRRHQGWMPKPGQGAGYQAETKVGLVWWLVSKPCCLWVLVQTKVHLVNCLMFHGNLRFRAVFGRHSHKIKWLHCKFSIARKSNELFFFTEYFRFVKIWCKYLRKSGKVNLLNLSPKFSCPTGRNNEGYFCQQNTLYVWVV